MQHTGLFVVSAIQCRFNQGGSYYYRGLKSEQGAEPPWPPHFNHCACHVWPSAVEIVTFLVINAFGFIGPL